MICCFLLFFQHIRDDEKKNKKEKSIEAHLSPGNEKRVGTLFLEGEPMSKKPTYTC